MLDELGADHRAWLLVAANNYLGQRRADCAIILLELLDLLDPEDAQCQKLLAYAHWLQGDGQRFAGAVERVLRQPLAEAERDAMQFMKRQVGGAGAASIPASADMA